jgi:hypothetical protein
VKGIDVAPPTMRQSEEPVARYFPDLNVVLFVSAPRYSSSCPPSAEADTNAATLTLAVKCDSSEGDCTSDANRYTFPVQGFDEEPTRLVIEEEQENIELGLGD